MKKLFTLLLTATLCIGVGWADVTVSKTIAEIAGANGWSNGNKYVSFSLDGIITVSCSGGGNTGKYYTSGNNWRLYQNEDPILTVSAASGYSLNSITVTYTVVNYGVLVYDNTEINSPATVSVSGTSAEFSVGNSRTETNGQVRITAIAVTYSSIPSATVQAPTLTDEFTFWPVMNDAASAQVTISPATGNTVRYTTNGSTPSRTNGTEITDATTITISGTTTVKAISYVGTQTSSVVSKTYTLGQTVTGISAFKNLTSGTTVRLYLPDDNNARTLYVNGNEAFVRDNTGAICIYNVTTNPPLEYNQHIAGWIIGKFTEHNGLPEFVVSGDYTNSNYLVIADKVTEDDVEPVEINADEYGDYHADWVTINDLHVTSSSGNTATASVGNTSFSIYNKYNPENYQLPYEDAIVDITGIAVPYNNTQQLRPIYQNDYWPLTYVVDAQEGFVAPTTDIPNAQVRLKRNLIQQDWSVLAVPFELEDFEGDVLEYTGVTLGQVGTYDYEGNTYPIYSGVMQFENYYGTLQPGVPYLVRPYSTQHGVTLSGVTLKAGTAGSVTKTLSVQQNAPSINLKANNQPVYAGDYSLVGTYSPTTLPKNESTVVIVDSRTLSWTSLLDNTEVGGTEGYITVPDGAGVKLSLPENEVITGVVAINACEQMPRETVIYNLLGVRLTRPLSELPPGIYIVNGKKIVKR